jgi:hypothetical protein
MRTILAGQTIPALQPLVEIADQKLGSRMLSPSTFTDMITEPSTLGRSSQVSEETRAALVKQGLSLNLRQVKILKRVKFQQNTFECYSHSRVNGLVEYSALGQDFGVVGYIHEIFECMNESGASAAMVCIAQCCGVDDQFLPESIALGARLCGREIQDYVVVAISMLAHVVRYPWSPTTQLVISVHNIGDTGTHRDTEGYPAVDFQDDDPRN